MSGEYLLSHTGVDDPTFPGLTSSGQRWRGGMQPLRKLILPARAATLGPFQTLDELLSNFGSRSRTTAGRRSVEAPGILTTCVRLNVHASTGRGERHGPWPKVSVSEHPGHASSLPVTEHSLTM